jgi:DNA uptake protein ComE-like DNA-binding protein
MVLVLAKRSQDAHEEVLDYANYPAREHFSVPSLQGAVSHSVAPDHVSVRVARIHNPRGSENLSGTLALELWALSEPYTGGQFQGQALAGVELGRLAGQGSLEALERVLPFTAAPAPDAHWTLMLREWTANGYVTRDYRNLASPRPAAMIAAPQAAAQDVLSDPNTAESAAPAPEAAPAPQPVAAAAASSLVSIRHASLEELAGVPGLNRKLAAEIIKARPYSSLDQLLKVRGIGDKTLRKLRSVLTL